MLLNNLQAINQALYQEMERDPAVIVLGEDVGVDGGVFRATDGLYKKFGRERVIDTPMCEATIVGASFGMAVLGLKPVAEIQFNGFIFLAANQLVAHVSRIRSRSRGRFACPLTLRVPWSGGFRALEHHGESPEAVFVHNPGLKVVMPATPYDTKGLLVASIKDPDPVLFLEPIKLYRIFKEEVPEELYEVEIGKAKIVRQGSDASLITYGTMLIPCLQVADELNKEGISVEVVDLRTLSPLDEETLLQSVRKTGRCVIVHEAPRACGLGAEIAALISEKILFHLKAPILRVTGYDTPMPLLKSEDLYIPNKEKVLSAVEEVLKY